MKPLDRPDPAILEKEAVEKYLNADERRQFYCIPKDERFSQLCSILEKPLDTFTPVNDLYFRGKWVQLFHRMFGREKFRLLEIAAGDADIIPRAMACSHPGSSYISANMNEFLNQSMLKKTKGLALDFQLIHDDAANLGDYLRPQSVDMIAFQHGVNDILQAILCGMRGIDTVYTDWMELLLLMIEILKEEVEAGTFAEHTKAPFLKLLTDLSVMQKPGGIMAIHHYMFRLDLDLGYPLELFENLVPMVREWILECGIFEEIRLEGFEPQWWLFLRRR